MEYTSARKALSAGIRDKTMKHIFCVGGVFDDEGGRPSGYFDKLTEELHKLNAGGTMSYANGGFYSEMEEFLRVAHNHDTVLWAADVPNDKPKLVKELKKLNPKLMLIITKSNKQSKYSRKHLAARALQSKANLLIEFNEDSDSRITASLIDPLGNCFIDKTPHVSALAAVLFNRLRLLEKMVRVESVCVGGIASPLIAGDDKAEFFEIVKDYAKQFHTLIHAEDNGRMLGNLSFRCEGGFPSMRAGDLLMVSRRDVDKRSIGMPSMVPVELELSDKINYYGDNKPSVDTPIQRLLYQAWPLANYMLHAHVYIEGAPYTEIPLPCGALQEAGEVLLVMPEYDGKALACVNLVGHGSIAVARDVSMLKNIPYIPRPIF